MPVEAVQDYGVLEQSPLSLICSIHLDYVKVHTL